MVHTIWQGHVCRCNLCYVTCGLSWWLSWLFAGRSCAQASKRHLSLAGLQWQSNNLRHFHQVDRFEWQGSSMQLAVGR